MSDGLNEEARLAILGELNKQSDGRLNETLLDRALAVQGYSRSREWLRTQLRKLEELDAIHITVAGDLLIAGITRAGLEHYEKRSNIDGIASRPRWS
ncbi:hypothetical protein [Tianweitania sediminis]|uniref:Phage related protein n=1 Tax=Tianweitania sediminis TaxID=1502156 RepID=A0A8J7QZ58_9HYPH|nr:hypothetical protein [Tianweitania sediminis]MBP0439448.1 hypothetical protein [Tianweitania sediminis]